MHTVTVNGLPCLFLLSDPIGSVTSLAPSLRGLEVLSVVSNVASFANICELTIQLPDSLCVNDTIMNDQLQKVRIEISYSITGSVGALVFAPSLNSSTRITKKRQRVIESDASMHNDFSDAPLTVLFAATKLNPDISGTISGRGLGPRCIYPCADVLSINTFDQAHVGTFSLAFTVSGADSLGMLAVSDQHKPVKIEVIASGDSLDSEIVPLFGFDYTSLNRTKCWRFAVREPTRPSSIGFVAGPLCPFSSIDVRLVISNVTSATSSLFSSPPTTQRSNSGGGGGTSSEMHVNVAHFAPATLLNSQSGIVQHARRTRRMLVWLSEWLRVRYPFTNHRNVFLPSSVLEATASLYATPTGLMPMLSGGSDFLHGDVFADLYCMAGLTLLPDTLLTSNRIFDPEASVHAAQAFGLASSWIGCCLRASIWQDLWLLQGLARYLVAIYLRSFRGEADFGLWLERLCEGTARLEDECPALQPLYPRIVEYSSANLPPSLCANSPITVQHPFRDSHMALKAPAVCNIFATHVGESRFRNAVSAIVVKSLSPQLECATSISSSHSYLDDGGRIRFEASIAGQYGFLSSLSFFSCMKLCCGGGERSAELIDSLADKWVFGLGVPTIFVGLQYQADSNRINITIEQIMKPGSEFFRGELPIYVVERSEAGPSLPPDTWHHTVILTRARETFSLPCHTRTQRIVGDYWGDTSVRLGKKRGRSSKKKSSETAAATIVTQSAVAGEGNNPLEAVDSDDINRSPIEWIRIDPNRTWLRRLHVSLPPCMSTSQLCCDPDISSQIEAMRSMAELLCGDALAVPGGGSLPMPSAGSAFPTVEEPPLKPQDPTSTEIDMILRSDTALAQQKSLASALNRLGYYPRPTNLWRPMMQFVSMIIGVDHSQGKFIMSGHNSKTENHKFTPSLHWRIRVAAAVNFARWQSGRLPGYGKTANSSTHQQTYAGLAALISLYQRLFFSIPTPALVFPGGTTETSEKAIHTFIESISSYNTGDGALLSLATSGVPGDITFSNIENMQVQRALVRAIGSIRHPDGIAPDASIAFLSYILRAYDSNKISAVYDDTSLLTDLIRSLGSCMIASDGARLVARVMRQNMRESSKLHHDYQPGQECASSVITFADFLPPDPTGTLDCASVEIYKEAWAILREQLALELLSLRHSMKLSSASGDSVTCGTCAAVCLSVLSILEARFVAPPVSASPILYSYIGTVHPSGQFRIPPRLRLAAFSALSRIILLSTPYLDETNAESPTSEDFNKGTPILSANWVQNVGRLIDAAVSPSLNENAPGLIKMFILTLFVLQSRTDLDSEYVRDSHEYFQDVGFAGSASVTETGDNAIVERLRQDLRRAMLDERNTEADVRAILDGSGLSTSGVRTTIQATTFITRWTFTEAAVDLGIYDLQRNGESAMSMQERRKYGTLRVAPSFRGCLSPLAKKNDDDSREIASLWSFLKTCSRLPQTDLFQTTFHLLHSIFGLLPIKAGPTAIAQSEGDFSNYSSEIDRFTDYRRDAIQLIRSKARTAHLQAALSYAQGKVLQQQTGTSPSLIDDEDDENNEDNDLDEDFLDNDVVSAGINEDGDKSNDEDVPESMMEEQTVISDL